MTWYLVALCVVVIVDILLTIFPEFLPGQGFAYVIVMHIISFIVLAYIVVYLFQKNKALEQEAEGKIQLISKRQEETQGDLSSVLYNLPGAVTVVSPYFMIQQMNAEVERITGVNKEEALGKKCFTVFGDGKICPNCPVQRAFKTKQVEKHIKRELSRKDTEIFIELTAIPLLDLEGKVKNVIEIVIDITQEVKLKQEQKETFVQTVTALAALIDGRDVLTGVHSSKVREIAVDIGNELGLSLEIVEKISIAAILHDIGKISTPEAILNKPGKLTETEYSIIKKHAKTGYDTLNKIPSLGKIAEYILYHHERYDGSGYPYGISGEAIPLISRILAVADVFEAVTADRVYRKSMSLSQAFFVMYQGKGTHFDPSVLEAFFAVMQRKNEESRTMLAESQILKNTRVG